LPPEIRDELFRSRVIVNDGDGPRIGEIGNSSYHLTAQEIKNLLRALGRSSVDAQSALERSDL